MIFSSDIDPANNRPQQTSCTISADLSSNTPTRGYDRHLADQYRKATATRDTTIAQERIT